jgi:hypothetical protein
MGNCSSAAIKLLLGGLLLGSFFTGGLSKMMEGQNKALQSDLSSKTAEVENLQAIALNAAKTAQEAAEKAAADAKKNCP